MADGGWVERCVTTAAHQHTITELPLYAERLLLRLPYVRHEKNDLRHAKEFLDEIRSLVKRGHLSRRKLGTTDEYETPLDANDLLTETDVLMIAWSNRDTHEVDEGDKTEALQFIVTYQKAPNLVRCASKSCEEMVWTYPKHDGKQMQCGCGGIKWKAPS